MKRFALPFVAGILFALGLVLAGMTDPARVLGFLDVTGAWDPRLAVVMVGAVGVHATFLLATRRRARPLFATSFPRLATDAIDARLLGGAALFGVGWGLAGVCPGPALVSVGSFATKTIAFAIALVAGSVVASWLVPPHTTPAADEADVGQGAATSK